MANGSRLAAWEFFGAELRRRREDMGLSQAQLGAIVFVSGTYIGQFEQAIRKPQMELAIRFDEILKTDGIFERLYHKLIKDQPYTEYFAHVVELEQQATEIWQYAPMVVPGVLQTREYAKALYVASSPLATDKYIEDLVKGRMDRAQLLKDAARPVYWAVLHEAVLRIPVGGPETMAHQLDDIAALIRERKVLVQVMPFAAGPHPYMGKLLTLMEFADAPPTVYTEGVLSGNLLDEPAVVKRARKSYDLIRAAALSPEASLALIEATAEDYRQCASTT